mmetsp:Transcript_120713/g.346851  ORF Transcript_120713/g.346851 Transcript_120713/m.346851 type:complete len:354 (+) Transcript_120713:220-1281(+)
MAQNPLLGSRISLISKKNIRYEGTLYSINEANATVALQNVRSYGTEGREQLDPETSFVAPQDAVHPYLLFRGCDIKDLHVHETTTEKPAIDDPAIVAAPAAADLPPPPPPPQPQSQPTRSAAQSKEVPSSTEEKENESKKGKSQPTQPQGQGGRGSGVINRRPRKPNPANQIGTGASLLNRKARGTVEGIGPETPQEEFDFQSKLEEFEKEPDEEEEAGDLPEGHSAYEKDDFFDSISCDALDREKGIDNRLRGAQERNLNTETFGAVALNSQRRRRGRGGPNPNGRGEGTFGNGSGVGGNAGRGGGRGGGRGRGPGRGRGRGRGRSGGRGEGIGGRGRGGGRHNTSVRTESD